MPCIANTIFFILLSELQGYCLVCEVSLPLGIWEHSVPGAWGRVRAVAVQPAFVYRGKLGCCFDSPVCCCLHLQLWENHKGFAQIPLTTGACISNDQNSVAPGGRQLISLIFSNNPARPWLHIIVSSRHSPGCGAVESWYLVRWLFHFLPRAGAKVFTFPDAPGPWHAGWRPEQEPRKSLILRGVSVALFIEERVEAGGE